MGIKRHWAYFKYVIKHKWYVFEACMEYGVPLHRALLYDWSKFTFVEWSPYAHQFFNEDGSKRRGEQSDEFKRAWLHHQRNKHHWQAWLSIGDGGVLSPIPMPDTYVREMVAD